MIYPVEMFSCKCDNCGKQWLDTMNSWVAMTDEVSLKSYVSEDSSWLTKGDKHYCSNCFGFDDDDNLVIAPHPSEPVIQNK